jgi:pimeloyl-ACP methyl ester carboxylesterase
MSTILFLHGAIGSSNQLSKIYNRFENSITFNFPGHGNTKIPTEFSIELFSKAVIDLLDKNQLKKVSIFGYSMGGYVGLYLAVNYSNRIEKVFCHGTKLLWNEESAWREMKLLDPKLIEEKAPQFASHLETIHGDNWPLVLTKTTSMLQEMGKNPPLDVKDFQTITCPILISLGDQDKTANLEDSVVCLSFFQKVSFSVLPNTPHPLEKTDCNRLVEIAATFFED